MNSKNVERTPGSYSQLVAISNGFHGLHHDQVHSNGIIHEVTFTWKMYI